MKALLTQRLRDERETGKGTVAKWVGDGEVLVRLEVWSAVCRSVWWVVARWDKIFTTLRSLGTLVRVTSPSLLAVMKSLSPTLRSL